MEVRWNGNAVPARWMADGALVACEGQSRGPETGNPTCVERGRGLASGRPPNLDAGIDARVTAGLCLTQLEATVGAPVVIPRGSTIVLRADDADWAYGRITQVDGALAVEITRKLAVQDKGTRIARPLPTMSGRTA